MPRPGNVRYSRDPDEPFEEPSEFSKGYDLDPRAFNYAPPSLGGQYRGTCEPTEITFSYDLTVHTLPVRRKYGTHGYPGDQNVPNVIG